MACPLPLNLVCGAVGSASSSLAGGVLSAVAGWVIEGASWLLNSLGGAITSTTTVNLREGWFLSHYQVMLAIASVVGVPMLVLAAVQAVYHQNGAVLVRAAFVHLPLAGVLTAVAVQVVQLSLAATDELCTSVTGSTGGQLDKALHAIGSTLGHQLTPLPTFVMTVGALLIVTGAFALWLELLVRSAAVYAAVLFLPLAIASLMWPAISHWCRRLVETLAAIVLSKLVVVAILALAVGAISSGHGFSTVLAGGALLLLAAFTPFTLLRLVPLVEIGAAMQLEGARHRVRSAAGRVPDSVAGLALRQAREHGAHRETVASPSTPGLPGTGTTVDPGIPGSGGDARAGLSGSSGSSGLPGSSGSSGLPGSSGPDGGQEKSGSGAPARDGGGGRSELAPPGAGSVARAGSVAAAGAGEVPDAGRAEAPGQLPLGPMPREWLPPGDLSVPPGTVPVWQGSPESVIAALEAEKRPRRVEPDGYGGVIPGVASPLWGGTEPFSRFEPGPKDNWDDWPEEGGNGEEPFFAGGAGRDGN